MVEFEAGVVAHADLGVRVQESDMLSRSFVSKEEIIAVQQRNDRAGGRTHARVARRGQALVRGMHDGADARVMELLHHLVHVVGRRIVDDQLKVRIALVENTLDGRPEIRRCCRPAQSR
ncbi:MAG: hypothetical protein R2851_20015 [Caldilineaceae bacterium]